METAIYGEVSCDEVPHVRSVRKFVYRRIQRWLESHPDIAKGIKAVSFSAHFQRLGPSHQVACFMQVDCGQGCWRGSASADGLHRSLIYCMDNLEPRTRSVY